VNDYDALAAQLRRARKEKRVLTGDLDAVESALTRASRDHDLATMASRTMALQEPRATVRERRTYDRGNGHSMLADLAQVKLRRGDADGGVKAAQARLDAHDREVRAELPRITERRAAQARYATEQALTRSVAEIRALERFTALGGKIFTENRAISRTDGAGGYFVPPLWLIDEYVPYALSGRPFANLFTLLPLPPRTDVISLPRVTLGPATGAQAADLGPAGARDLQDSAALGQVRTVAGQVDMPAAWLDQRPGDADAILLPQLMADYGTQVDGLMLLGSNGLGQPNGIMPAGAIGAANLISLGNTNNTAAQQWAFGGTGGSVVGSPHYASAQLLSILGRLRAQRPTHFVVNDVVWSLMCAAADAQNRPLVPPGVHAPDATPSLHGLPLIIDPAVPATFAASGTQPYIGAVTSGQAAPVAGSGTYTPVLLGKWDDAFLWEGDYRVAIMQEVLAGELLVRVQMRNYIASIPNRLTWGGANTTFSGTNQSGGINAGGAVSYGALTQTVSNSVLQGGNGF